MPTAQKIKRASLRIFVTHYQLSSNGSNFLFLDMEQHSYFYWRSPHPPVPYIAKREWIFFVGGGLSESRDQYAYRVRVTNTDLVVSWPQ